jgi:hypothetical protein
MSDYRLELLKAVLSYFDSNDCDLPLTLVESIRVEIAQDKRSVDLRTPTFTNRKRP